MVSTTVSRVKRFHIVVFLLSLPLQQAFSAPQADVSYNLQWGSFAQSYTYVFSGQVTCQNNPCQNARVDLDLETATQGVITQTTRTSADGHYQIEVTFQASPSDCSTWKLEAHSASVSHQQSAEAEGRIILTEGQAQVVVDRSLHLTEA